MKRLLLGILSATLISGVALAAHPLSPAYRAVYCYPGGSYWVNQIAHYPDYYAAHNSHYVTHYGAATQYCPV